MFSQNIYKQLLAKGGALFLLLWLAGTTLRPAYARSLYSSTAQIDQVDVSSVVETPSGGYFGIAVHAHLAGSFSVNPISWLLINTDQSFTIEYTVEIWQDQWLLDSKLETHTYAHTMSYNWLTDTYTVVREEENGGTGATHTGLSATEADQLMRSFVFRSGAAYGSLDTIYAKVQAKAIIPWGSDETTNWGESPHAKIGGVDPVVELYNWPSSIQVGVNYDLAGIVCNGGSVDSNLGYFTIVTNSSHVHIGGAGYSRAPGDLVWNRYLEQFPNQYYIYEWELDALEPATVAGNCQSLPFTLTVDQGGGYWLQYRWTLMAPDKNGNDTSTYVGTFDSTDPHQVEDQQGWYSVQVDFTVIPSSPSSVSASDGTYADRVAVSWSSVSGATQYHAFRCTTTSTSSCSQIYSGSSTSYNDTGASPGTTYYYRVKACNAAGCSGYSGYDAGYRLAAPVPPSSVQASDGTYTDRVAVSWSSVSGATQYQAFRCTTTSTSSCSQIYSGSSTSYNDTNASPGTTYYYRVKACNAAGCSGYSSYNAGYRAVAVPSAPSSISASDGTYADRVVVTWSSVSGATQYHAFRCTTTSTSSCSQIYSGSSTSYNDTSASPGTTYYYRAKACNSAGCSGYSSYNAGYRLAAPVPPSSVQASDGTYTDRGAVTWSSVSGATQYHAFRCTTTSTSSCSQIYSGSSTSYNDTSASPGTTYYYRAKACNSAGCSGYSGYDAGYRQGTTSSARSDVGVYVSGSGAFVMRLQNGGTYGRIWVSKNAISIAGDWDGDGKDDPGVYLPGSGAFVMRLQNGGTYGRIWASKNAIPIVGDWNGDGKDDPGVYLPGSGAFVMRLQNGGTYGRIWASANAKPIVGDWNGDGKDDPGVYLPGSGALVMRLQNGGTYGRIWASANADPIVGDWDGQ